MSGENWLRVSIYTTPQGIEPLYAAVLGIGIEGAEICDEGDFLNFLENNREMWDYVDDKVLKEKKAPTHLNVFIRDDEAGRQQLSKLYTCLESLKNTGLDVGSLDIKIDDVREDMWFENWKKHYQPLNIGKKIIVVPAWLENPETDRTILKINPGMLFGTGSHNTTRLCMKILEETVKEGDELLDIGCGSGILSILALLLGASFAAAVDIVPAAPRIAYENAALNGIGKDTFFVTTGNILEDEPLKNTIGDRKYDIVVANIVADVIIPLSGMVHLFMKKGAKFLCSGIINERAGDVCRALASNGFDIMKKEKDGDWCAFLCGRK